MQENFPGNKNWTPTTKNCWASNHNVDKDSWRLGIYNWPNDQWEINKLDDSNFILVFHNKFPETSNPNIKDYNEPPADPHTFAPQFTPPNRTADLKPDELTTAQYLRYLKLMQIVKKLILET
jgi:hypothetical protein